MAPQGFVDVRLVPSEPSRLWLWWVASTPRAIVRKCIGLDLTDRNARESDAAVFENAGKQIEVIKTLRSDVERLAQFAVKTEQRLAYYEQHDESIKYLKAKLARGNRDGLGKGSGIVLLNHQ